MDLEQFLVKNQCRFHYDRLNAAEKQAYDALVHGFFRLAKTIGIPVSCTKVQKVYDAVCRDLPELFFVREIHVSYYVYERENCRVIPTYRFSGELIYGTFMEMEQMTAPLLRRISGMSDLQKEKEIHDHLIRTVTYKDKEKAHSHEAPGAILYGIGVCEGIAKAFKYMAERAGLAAVVVYGSASAEQGGHAWNAVRVNGRWYHLDVTFDATISDRVIRYDYFNLSSREISVDHQYEAAPLCPEGMEYYRSIGCFASSAKELKRLARKYLQADAPMVFQLPEIVGTDPDALPQMVLNLLSDAVWYRSLSSRTISLNCNMERMVFQAQLE